MDADDIREMFAAFRRNEDIMSVNATARSLLLTEFVSAYFLAMRYFFKPKPTLNYPFEKDRSRRASAVNMHYAVPQWRGALHRELCEALPGAGHHHRGRSAPQ